MGRGCSVSARGDVQLWMLPPTSYDIAAEPGAVPGAWFGVGCLHCHHAMPPACYMLQAKQTAAPEVL